MFVNPPDVSNVWLPFAPVKSVRMPFEVAYAYGCSIFLRDGKGLVDGLSNWWSACHGHSNKYITKKCFDQAEKFPHISFCGLASSESLRFGARLIELLDSNLKYVFFSDSGSTAVEVAMRIAFQYYKNLGIDGRKKFVFFKNGYHGDTMGCVSVSDLNAIHGDSIKEYVPQNIMFDIEFVLKSEFEDVIFSEKDSIIAFIIEPILQAAGGMKFHSMGVLQKLRAVSEKFGILLIFDEVAVGFSRLGSDIFVHKWCNCVPDLLVLGKSIAGGFCALGATIASSEIYGSFYESNAVFSYGSTFMANPISCAAANASLDLFEMNGCYLKEIAWIETVLLNGLTDLMMYDYVKDVRVMGALGVVEVAERVNLNAFIDECIRLGVWLRPLGCVIYIMPPYIVSKGELEKLIAAVRYIVVSRKYL